MNTSESFHQQWHVLFLWHQKLPKRSIHLIPNLSFHTYCFLCFSEQWHLLTYHQFYYTGIFNLGVIHCLLIKCHCFSANTQSFLYWHTVICSHCLWFWLFCDFFIFFLSLKDFIVYFNVVGHLHFITSSEERVFFGVWFLLFVLKKKNQLYLNI